ncbi:MAG: hypothetical protein J3K34DRAFT_411457 [Monoraphidium minutum]|nr:MAG: hypothetical protein J3K34DRAFT_411457 [Monoraphidium minutum]
MGALQAAVRTRPSFPRRRRRARPPSSQLPAGVRARICTPALCMPAPRAARPFDFTNHRRPKRPAATPARASEPAAPVAPRARGAGGAALCASLVCRRRRPSGRPQGPPLRHAADPRLGPAPAPTRPRLPWHRPKTHPPLGSFEPFSPRRRAPTGRRRRARSPARAPARRSLAAGPHQQCCLAPRPPGFPPRQPARHPAAQPLISIARAMY